MKACSVDLFRIGYFRGMIESAPSMSRVKVQAGTNSRCSPLRWVGTTHQVIAQTQIEAVAVPSLTAREGRAPAAVCRSPLFDL